MTSTSKVVPLKNPWIAGLLAYLVPGAGHLYQGRRFKGIVYFVCILGTFFYGMHLGEWKVVYANHDPGGTFAGRGRKRSIAYFAQVSIGVAALPAIVQSRRYYDPDNRPVDVLHEALSAPFTGRMIDFDGSEVTGKLAGRISLEPDPDGFGQVRGTFTGTRDGKQSVELDVAGPIDLGPEVAGNDERALVCYVSEEQEGEDRPGGAKLVGNISRSFWNWFEAPLDAKSLGDLHGRLGKYYELAMVYTWIAGLLNILAFWDALEGPAYGYGDEVENGEKQKKKREAADASQSSETSGDAKRAEKSLT